MDNEQYQLYQSSPALWCQEFVTITHPTRGRIPFDLYDYQFDWLSDRSQQRVALKARQVGMSQTIAAEALHLARFNEGATILFVSRSLDAATNLLDYVKDILINLDDGVPVKVVKKGSQRLVFSNRSRIMSVPATPNTGRTYAATAVYMDEGAFLPWAETIYTAVMPTVSRGGRISILSTPNGTGNLFYDLCGSKRPKYGKITTWAGDNAEEGWSMHTVHWTACPEYDEKWYLDKRPQYDESSWYSEFECNFEMSGNPIFLKNDIDRMQDGWRESLSVGYPNRMYVTAWDIGRMRDATVGITMDVTDPIHQIVAYEHFEAVPLPYQQQKIVERIQKFPGLHIVEGNDKGDAVIENIGEPYIRFIERFWTSPTSKPIIITALRWAVEWGYLKMDVEGEHSRIAEEMLQYRLDDKNLVQDCVMALAIAEHKIQWRDQEEEVHVDAEYHIEDFNDFDGGLSWPGPEGFDFGYPSIQ